MALTLTSIGRSIKPDRCDSKAVPGSSFPLVSDLVIECASKSWSSLFAFSRCFCFTRSSVVRNSFPALVDIRFQTPLAGVTFFDREKAFIPSSAEK